MEVTKSYYFISAKQTFSYQRTNCCKQETWLNYLFRDVCTGYDAKEHTLFCMLCFSIIENDRRSCLQACCNLFHWWLTIFLNLLDYYIFFWHFMQILKTFVVRDFCISKEQIIGSYFMAKMAQMRMQIDNL